MKFRSDFVTNSSSSSYLITLTIVDKDDTAIEFKGNIDETSDGYLDDGGEVDPRKLVNAADIDELKQLLSSFGTLSDIDYTIKDATGKTIDCWNPEIIPDCPEDEGMDMHAYQDYLSSLYETVCSMDSVKSISVKCEGESYAGSELSAKVIESYAYDTTTGKFTQEYLAIDEGEDVTDQMLNDHYCIDCSEGTLEFQLRLEEPEINTNNPLMISQYPAIYLYERSEKAKTDCIAILKEMGFSKSQAKRFFDYECGILKRYRKSFLTNPNFVKMWAFNLREPIFSTYPSTKEELKKEHFLTVSELCMIMDEAECHFRNNNQENLPDEVWDDICSWRLQGAGLEFAIDYFTMISVELGLPIELMQRISNREGSLMYAKYKI